jgi:hypothetical protein
MGRVAMIRPVIELNKKDYFVDMMRLELRLVSDPTDTLSIATMSLKELDDLTSAISDKENEYSELGAEVAELYYTKEEVERAEPYGSKGWRSAI